MQPYDELKYIDIKIVIKGPQGPWQEYFAWTPKRINGRWYWLTLSLVASSFQSLSFNFSLLEGSGGL